jgi:hypothetical protein
LKEKNRQASREPLLQPAPRPAATRFISPDHSIFYPLERKFLSTSGKRGHLKENRTITLADDLFTVLFSGVRGIQKKLFVPADTTGDSDQ